MKNLNVLSVKYLSVIPVDVYFEIYLLLECLYDMSYFPSKTELKLTSPMKKNFPKRPIGALL